MKKELIAGWSFTNACNLRCKHCYNASGRRKEDELSLNQAIEVANKLKKANVVAVNFGGGECALRADFIDLCKYLHSLDIKISYTTNGTTLPLIINNLNLFHDIGVSIDFADEEKHDKFRGVKGTYRKALATIKELIERGVDTEIVTCITSLNSSPAELQRLYNLSKELKVNYWRLNRFRANGRGIDNKDYLQLSQRELKRAYSFLARHIPSGVCVPEPIFRAAFGGDYSISGDPSGNTAFRIQPNGEVSPSVFLSESGGNILLKSFDEIFDSEIFKKISDRKPTGKCISCKEYYHCKGGDAGASYLQYGNFNGPDPLCWLKSGERNENVRKKYNNKWNVHEKYLCTVYIPIK